jgi:hypothetical protein
MALMKRKHSDMSATDDNMERATKRLKSTNPIHDLNRWHRPETKNNVADDYQPSSPESRNDENEANIRYVSTNDLRRTHRAMKSAEKHSKQRYLDDQVSFIIITRDNNKPDAYGTKSTTHAPLTWSAVAEAYNKKYGVSVTAAAMEKRVRHHRAEWLKKHPNYPTEIVYAKKDKVPKVFEQRKSAAKTKPQSTQDILDRDISNERIAGWLPPDDIRNQSDMRNYIERAAAADTSVVTLEVLDNHEELVEAVPIDRQIFQLSSGALRRLQDGESKLRVQLSGPLVNILQCYIDCTSCAFLPVSSNDEVCNAVSLIQLYCLAAQLEDDYVMRLVLDRWQLLSNQNEEVDVPLDELNLLFDCTHHNDPARAFWVETVCAAGKIAELLAMEACGEALASHLRNLV